MSRREVEIAVISDAHLGTYGCHANELLHYLRSIKPKILILNGDIIDFWQYSKSYFPKSHLGVIHEVLDLAQRGTKVYYLTGNHDDLLRKFTNMSFGNIELRDKVLLDIDGKFAWAFHGDVFDTSITHARWLARLGSKGYELLLRINRFVNWILKMFGRPKKSFSKAIKDKVKRAVKKVNDFEQTAADIAIENGYTYVICGHIHKPQFREVHHSNKNKEGSALYLNSGDWIENLTSLEYNTGEWKIFYYNENTPEEMNLPDQLLVDNPERFIPEKEEAKLLSLLLNKQ